MTRRLFIFASWDKDRIVDDTVVYYLRALSELGDIVFFADCGLPPDELKKIKSIPNVIYADAEHHGEYDFGSYKRGYQWAAESGILKNYDWVYLCNDSVYGPLTPLGPILEEMESYGADAVGLVSDEYPLPFFLHSWFIGLSGPVVESKFFDGFMRRIRRLDNKLDIIRIYEVGLTNKIQENGFTTASFYKCRQTCECYTEPLKVLNTGFPFIKKLLMTEGWFQRNVIRMYSNAHLIKLKQKKTLLSLPESQRSPILNHLERVDNKSVRRIMRPSWIHGGIFILSSLIAIRIGGVKRLKITLLSFIPMQVFRLRIRLAPKVHYSIEIGNDSATGWPQHD